MSNITLQQSYHTLPVKFTTFSDGSETCVIDNLHLFEGVMWVNIDIEDCNRDLIRLGLVKDTIDRSPVTTVKLNLNYTPQARADRVFGLNMPLPIKVFTNIINSYKFDEVRICDPHSDVSSALLDNVVVWQQHHILRDKMKEIKQYMPEFTLCAPDLGAIKKIFDSVMMLGHQDYIQAVKIRDVLTGDIIKCDLTVDKVSGDVLIVDDLSDAAGSFKFLAQKLKAAGATRVGLFVTHGIFSKGLKVLEKDVDFIFCNGIVGEYINREDLRKFNDR